LTVHLPSIEHTTEETTTIHAEEQIEKPSHEAPTPHIEQVTTLEEEREEPTATKEDKILESSKTSAVETVQETTSEDRRPSSEDITKENEAERLSSEALTEAVREILATPLTVHLPSVDIKTETIESTE